MDVRTYLLNMRVSGIKNIKEEVRLDFYKKTVNKDFNPDKYRIKAIYGENGSGKSALITAVMIFRDLIPNRNYLNESGTQTFLDEIINKSTRLFHFACEFHVSTHSLAYIYQYSVDLAKGKTGNYEIQAEMLQVKNGTYPNNAYQRIFESKNGELLYLDCMEEEKVFFIKKSMNLLSASSFIGIVLTNTPKKSADSEENLLGTGFQAHILACLLLSLRIWVYLDEEDQHDLYFLNKRLKESSMDSSALQADLLKDVRALDTLSGINKRHVHKLLFEEYKKTIDRFTKFIKVFKPDLLSIDINTKEHGDVYECDLVLNYGSYSINAEFESAGIKKLMRLFDCLSAASSEGIVFVDEMDSNMNDVYLCRLLEYFMYYGEGQLCFTTHNVTPMTVLRKNKNSIDFLSSDNHLVPWTSRGNASPENCYKNGMIKDLPFNIDAADFVGILGE